MPDHPKLPSFRLKAPRVMGKYLSAIHTESLTSIPHNLLVVPRHLVTCEAKTARLWTGMLISGPLKQEKSWSELGIVNRALFYMLWGQGSVAELCEVLIVSVITWQYWSFRRCIHFRVLCLGQPHMEHTRFLLQWCCSFQGGRQCSILVSALFEQSQHGACICCLMP